MESFEDLERNLRNLDKMKLAVIFPGMGYTCDKPLLYYSAKIASQQGYEIKRVEYGNFPKKVKGNKEMMSAAFETARKQTKEILKDVDWESFDEILFISKSIGTEVAAHYLKKHDLKARSISFTPLAETFLYARGEGIMFHGTKDPWVEDSSLIIEGCEKIGQQIYLTEDGNHSLETGDIARDLANLAVIMDVVSRYIAG